MADELDERFAQSLAGGAVRGDYVHEREYRKHYADTNYLERLQHHVFPSEPRQSFVPYRRQQLLHVRMCHKL